MLKQLEKMLANHTSDKGIVYRTYFLKPLKLKIQETSKQIIKCAGTECELNA